MGREDRPADSDFYETDFRSDMLSQGDLFADVPCGYPCVPEDLEDVPGSKRLFVSGPLPPGFAMLITPSCSMAQGEGRTDYDHPVRTLVPVLPASQLEALEILSPQQLAGARKVDELINYMYLPAHDQTDLPASLALLYISVTLDHDLLMATGRRIAQLAKEGAQQLQRKLTWFYGGPQLDRAIFNPPLD